VKGREEAEEREQIEKVRRESTERVWKHVCERENKVCLCAGKAHSFIKVRGSITVPSTS